MAKLKFFLTFYNQQTCDIYWELKLNLRRFPPRHGGLRIWLQQLRSLWRCWFDPWPSTVGEGSGCSSGGSRSPDLIPGPGTSTCHGCGLKKKKVYFLWLLILKFMLCGKMLVSSILTAPTYIELYSS